MSGKGSSYVANGVENCECAPAYGEGGPTTDEPELALLCNFPFLESDRGDVAAVMVDVEVYDSMSVSIFRSNVRELCDLFDFEDVRDAPARDSSPSDFVDVSGANFRCEPTELAKRGVLLLYEMGEM